MNVSDKGQFRNCLKFEMTVDEFAGAFPNPAELVVLRDESQHFVIYYMSVAGQPVIAEIRKPETEVVRRKG